MQYSITNVPAATSYTWTPPAGTSIQSGQNTTTILLNVTNGFSSGQLTVVANTTLCTPGTSIPRTITIFGKPNTPTNITPSPATWCNGDFVNFNTSVVAPLPTYNWTVSKGTITAGQGSSNIDVTWGTGTGTVTVNASNGCGASSNKVQSFSGISCREEGMISTDVFSVYPNPAHDKVTVSIDVNENTVFAMQIMDVSGRVVLSQDETGSAGFNTYELNLNHLAKGVYMLEVNSVNDNWKIRIVVE